MPPKQNKCHKLREINKYGLPFLNYCDYLTSFPSLLRTFAPTTKQPNLNGAFRRPPHSCTEPPRRGGGLTKQCWRHTWSLDSWAILIASCRASSACWLMTEWTFTSLTITNMHNQQNSSRASSVLYFIWVQAFGLEVVTMGLFPHGHAPPPAARNINRGNTEHAPSKVDFYQKGHRGSALPDLHS